MTFPERWTLLPQVGVPGGDSDLRLHTSHTRSASGMHTFRRKGSSWGGANGGVEVDRGVPPVALDVERCLDGRYRDGFRAYRPITGHRIGIAHMSRDAGCRPVQTDLTSHLLLGIGQSGDEVVPSWNR